MVIDTSIFIEFLRASNKKNTTLYQLTDDVEYSVSAVTVFELYMGATTAEKEKDIKLLIDGLTILPFTHEIAIKAAGIYHQLKKENKLIEFRDIFIAATCLVYEQPLVTLNTKHFVRIKELIIN